MSLSTLDAFNYLIKVALNLEIHGLEHPADYMKVLNMLKYAEIPEKCKIRLLVVIFEEMFVNGSKIIITKKENKINTFITYCKVHLIPDNIKNSSYLPTVLKLFSFIDLQQDELLLLYYLMINNKKPSLYYKILDVLLNAKNKYYVKNDKIQINDNISYVEFIKCVVNSINKYFKKNKKTYFKFENNNNEFKIKKLTKEEVEIYTNSQLEPLSKEKLIKIVKEKSIKNKIINNNNTEKIPIESKEILKNEISISNTEETPASKKEVNNFEKNNTEDNKNDTKKPNYEEKKIESKNEIFELSNTNIEDNKFKSKKEIYKIQMTKSKQNKNGSKNVICEEENPEFISKDNNSKNEKDFPKQYETCEDNVSTEQKIFKLNGEIGKLKNYKLNMEQKICELNSELENHGKKISELENQKISSNKKICELLGEIDQLKKRILGMEKDSERKESNYKKIVEEIKEKNNNFIINLRKEIDALKAMNNSLNIKLVNSNNKKEALEGEVFYLKSNLESVKKELNGKLNGLLINNCKLNKKIELVEKRETTKFLIDHIYSIIFKQYNNTLKIEDKSRLICEKLTKIKNKDNESFLKSFSEFLNKIIDEKKEGDQIAHPEYLCGIKTENKNIENFLVDYLEIKKQFSSYKQLYKLKNRKEPLDKKIIEINENVKNIDLFSYINIFLKDIKGKQ